MAALILQMLHDIVRHLKLLRGDQGELCPKNRQSVREGMHGPAVLQVSHQGYVEPVDGAFAGPHGEKVQKGLRRVGPGTVPGVYHRVDGELGSQSGGPFVRVPQHYGVTVCVHHSYGIGESLPFRYGCHGHLRNIYHIRPKPVGGALEREARPCGGLEEQIAQDPSGERLPGFLPHSIRHHLL
ncbi:hypothetical protein SDC9_192564 [bioreactor metagenome]|uniref:Uncharacterized protein n=1 Tax=bioreactor metagenome TaxID=1076179 RepID=A0A645I137_9ZZZZ